MMRAVFLASLLCLAVGCGGSPTDRVMGDSLSRPTGSPEVGEEWPALAFGLFRANHAVSGSPSWWLLDVACAKWNQCVWDDGDHDDVWWFLTGSNDIRYRPTAAKYRSALIRTADAIQAVSGASDFRIITSPHSWDRPGVDRRASRAWQDTMREIDLDVCASDPRFACVADLRGLLRDPIHYEADGAHLNRAGHAIVARAVADFER